MRIKSFTFVMRPGKLKETIEVLSAHPVSYQHDKVEAPQQTFGKISYEHRFSVFGSESPFNYDVTKVIDDLRAIK